MRDRERERDRRREKEGERNGEREREREIKRKKEKLRVGLSFNKTICAINYHFFKIPAALGIWAIIGCIRGMGPKWDWSGVNWK